MFVFNLLKPYANSVCSCLSRQILVLSVNKRWRYINVKHKNELQHSIIRPGLKNKRQGGLKNCIIFVCLTSSNIDQFSNFCHYHNKEKIRNIIKSLKITPHIKCVTTLTLPCEMSASLKQQLKTRRLL